MTHKRSVTIHPAQVIGGITKRDARSRVLGVGLLVAGALWLADISGALAVDQSAILAGFLIALGLGMVVGSKWGPYRSLVALSIFVIIWLISVSSLGGPIVGRVGSVEVLASSVSDFDRPYQLGIGDMTIDLTQVEFPLGETEVSGRLNIGELVVIVPRDLEVKVSSRSAVGQVSVLGIDRGASTVPINDTYETRGFSSATTKLVLKLDVAIGRIEVVRGRP